MFRAGDRVEMDTPVGWEPGTVRSAYPVGDASAYTVALDGVFGEHAVGPSGLRRPPPGDDQEPRPVTVRGSNPQQQRPAVDDPKTFLAGVGGQFEAERRQFYALVNALTPLRGTLPSFEPGAHADGVFVFNFLGQGFHLRHVFRLSREGGTSFLGLATLAGEGAPKPVGEFEFTADGSVRGFGGVGLNMAADPVGVFAKLLSLDFPTAARVGG
jgi:hypothetical protein